MSVLDKLNAYLDESLESAERIQVAIDSVKQKLAAEKNPKEKSRLQERLKGLQQRYIEEMRDTSVGRKTGSK